MVVDDDATTLTLLQAILEDAGYRVFTRDRAIGTAAEVARLRPDILLLDVNMPGLSGDRLAEVLTSRNRLGRTRLVFHSAGDVRDLARLASAHGAGWIGKSNDPTHLLRSLDAAAR